MANNHEPRVGGPTLLLVSEVATILRTSPKAVCAMVERGCPARQFTFHGERRDFALLRAIEDPSAQNRVRQLVLHAYGEAQDSEPNVAWSDLTIRCSR